MTKILKLAFTLAEVLITLGVIGVVAAVTIFREAEILCNVSTSTDANSALNNGEGSISSTISGFYWSSSESATTSTYTRHFTSALSYWSRSPRYDDYRSLCVGD